MKNLAEPKVLVRLYVLVNWYMQRTERFPKPLRISLGDKIDCHLLTMLERAVRARFAKDPRKQLYLLSSDVEVLRYLTRLAKDRGALQIKQYEYVARAIDEIGLQIGGWLKHLSKRDENLQKPVSESLGL